MDIGGADTRLIAYIGFAEVDRRLLIWCGSTILFLEKYGVKGCYRNKCVCAQVWTRGSKGEIEVEENSVLVCCEYGGYANYRNWELTVRCW